MVQENLPDTPLLTAAAELEDICRHEGWRACVIGGLAVLRWGRPRATRDVDLSLWTGFGAEQPYVDLLLDQFEPRVAGAQQFALDHRVLLLRAGNGTPLDIALAGIPFEQRMIARATPHEFASGCTLTTASAEDLIVLKAFADRPRDWIDIEGIVTRRIGELDWPQIEGELRPLAESKEDAEIELRLAQIRQTVERGS